MKKILIGILAASFIHCAVAEPELSEFKVAAAPLKDNELPRWMKDSQRLAKILDGDDIGEVTNPKMVGRYNTPIDGLFAVAIEATVTSPSKEARQEYFIFYTDKTNRYLVAGLLVDVEKGRNIGQFIEQYIRGNIASGPAKALNVNVLHAVQWNPTKEKEGLITMVIDIGPEEGRRNLLNVAALHQQLAKTGKVRPLRIVPVSNGRKEMPTAAMAMSLGFETFRTGDGYNKLLEYADIGEKASWLQKDRLMNDAKLKEALGIGAFKMEENTAHAILAKVQRLPLVYTHENGLTKNVPVPTERKEWETLLRKK